MDKLGNISEEIRIQYGEKNKIYNDINIKYVNNIKESFIDI